MKHVAYDNQFGKNRALDPHKKDAQPKEEEVFSMNDVKIQYHNELLLNRFISMLGIKPELDKNKRRIKPFLNLGKVVAQIFKGIQEINN